MTLCLKEYSGHTKLQSLTLRAEKIFLELGVNTDEEKYRFECCFYNSCAWH